MENTQLTRKNAHTGMLWRRRWGITCLLVLLALAFIEQGHYVTTSVGAATDLDTQALYEMAMRGDGPQALSEVRDNAEALGGWKPAPGDIIMYDSSIADNIRGVVMAVDLPPSECADPKLRRLTSECDDDFDLNQNVVRFGDAMFSTPGPDGTTVPRVAPDDLISTYIEEVGHSWQEYLYETEGNGQGPRTRLTSWEAGHRWKAGWEYQVKVYILNLNDTVLILSNDERLTLLKNICSPDSYANPINHVVPSYGPPPEWPNPEGWPTDTPTRQELDTFCADNAPE